MDDAVYHSVKVIQLFADLEGKSVYKIGQWTNSTENEDAGDLNPENFTDVLSGSLLRGRSHMTSAKSKGFLTPSPLSAFWTNL